MTQTPLKNEMLVKAPHKFIYSEIQGFLSPIKEAVRNKQVDIIIDFEGSSTIDSYGIGALISLLKGLKTNGGSITLRNLDDESYGLFVQMELDKVFSLQSRQATTHESATLFKPLDKVLLEIKKKMHNDICVLQVSGALNNSQDCLLLKRESLLAMKDSLKIILSLAGLHYIGSIGVGILLVIERNLHRLGGSLRICEPTESVGDALSALHIGKVIPIYGSLDDALSDVWK